MSKALGPLLLKCAKQFAHLELRVAGPAKRSDPDLQAGIAEPRETASTARKALESGTTIPFSESHLSLIQKVVVTWVVYPSSQ